MTTRTRFAPSPTGHLHIGGARTALYCWLYARRHNGQFVLRIEDTDRERSTSQAVEAILESMSWLGLEPDEGPYYQSERFSRYAELVEQLLAQGQAYHCYCSREELEEMRAGQLARKQKPRYDGRCREGRSPQPDVDPAVRFKTPQEGRLVVEDLVRGRVVFENAELDDLVICRSDGTPTYNFTVVVDDIDMAISHVIRGDDHLNNTPRQINIYRALGAEPPAFAHVPMILGPDGARLSKRHGATSVMEYREQGYLPEALLNYLVRLGWAHGDQEVFSREELVALFDITDVNKAASRINPEKLQWLNQHYIKSSGAGELAAELGWQLQRLGVDPSAGPPLERVVDALRERAPTLLDMARGSLFLFRDVEGYDDKAARKNLNPAALEPLAAVRERLAVLQPWDAPAIHTIVNAVAEEHRLKLGKVAQPIRVAVSGGSVSPPIDVTLALLGRERTIARLDRAREYILSST